MKLRKNMARFLTLSILLNNIYFCSNANVSSSETLSRYETLEGEVITLDDVEEDDITEIEIFGNTVQDENNLEDIQSVGELYVDESGEPILDSQGREQYKIDIESCNDINAMDNCIRKDGYRLNGENEDGSPKEQGWGGYSIITVPLRKDLTYVVNSATRIQHIYLFDAKNNLIRKQSNGFGDHKFTVDFNGYAKFSTFTENISKIYFGINLDYYATTKLPIPIQSHKTTILLPCQLQKVGGVADRLYWDSGTGRYVIEKNINSFVVNDISLAHPSCIGEYNYAYYINFDYNDDLSHGVNYRHGYLITGLKDIIYSYYNPNSEPWSFDKWGTSSLLIRYPREDKFSTEEKMLEYLEENNVSLFYQTKNPQIIETNIKSKLKIPTYDEKTHISVKAGNGISPTLKVTVDRIEQVSQEAVDLAMSSPTSSNIALARMYVNLLSESLYKDQLQEQLNQLFSSDMVLEKQSVTANLDVYIKSENMLSMSLDTNSITFEEYSGVEELELQNAINISINSSLPYSLNAYVVGDITNSDNSKTMDLDVLNIKDNSEVDYQKFDAINNKIVLKDSCNKGNNLNHAIDLKLSSNNAHKADVYKTTIKFEAEQK